MCHGQWLIRNGGALLLHASRLLGVVTNIGALTVLLANMLLMKCGLLDVLLDKPWCRKILRRSFHRRSAGSATSDAARLNQITPVQHPLQPHHI